VKGFSQRKGIGFDEIFSLVVKMTSIRMILGVAARDGHINRYLKYRTELTCTESETTETDIFGTLLD
jgi:hypothetical protein